MMNQSPAPFLENQLTQSLVMTPQLRQAIAILQMSHQEIEAMLARELETNPLLKMAEDSQDTPDASQADPSSSSADAAYLTAETSPKAATEEYDLHRSWEIDYQDVRNKRNLSPDNAYLYEEQVAAHESLRDHLIHQIGLELSDPVDRGIALFLLEELDDDGYVRTDLQETAERLGCSLGLIESVLKRLQYLDPPGLFTRTLGERLAIQLCERSRLTSPMAILLDHLNLLADGKVEALCKLCGVSPKELEAMIAEIRTLDPRPTDGFAEAGPAPLLPPDILVERALQGWKVELHPDRQPNLFVDRDLHRRIIASSRQHQERDYLGSCLSSANWLLKSLRQRAQTILTVAEEIVRRQQNFLEKGIYALQPMVLREVATALNIHESTVSRAISNKYIATPRGTFEMKFFFTTALQSTNGIMSHSSRTVQYHIRALIENEKENDRLSDDKIAALLQNEGIDIARRTVAKYRESMAIPSSAKRRRLAKWRI